MGVGTNTTYFVGGHYEVVNGVITKYYYAGSQRIAMRTNGTLNFILGDHVGSTSLTTDANGVVISEMRYKAWGETRYASGTTPTKYQYTGQYSYASDFGLHFYNARWYDSGLSRFAQADTIVPSGVQGYDRYAYTNNNPVKYTDPSGHDPICEQRGVRCNTRISTPDWWGSDNARDKSHIYVEGYGYFDTGHIKRGWDTAEYLYTQTELLGKNGGDIVMKGDEKGSFKLSYTLAPNLSGDELTSALYGIFTDFEYAYEEHQWENWNPSGFSPEDPPSDHLGFWAYANGLEKREIPGLLETLGKVSAAPPEVFDWVMANGNEAITSYPRNYEFSPMVTDLIEVGGGVFMTETKNISWPSWLDIEPSSSSPTTWQRR